MAALISANLKGGGALGSNRPGSSPSPLIPPSSRASSPSDVGFTGVLTFSAQFLSLDPLEAFNVGPRACFLQDRKGLILAETVELPDVRPVLGLGYILGRGLRPHSENIKLAIEDPEAKKKCLVSAFWVSLKFIRERQSGRGRQR